MHRMILPNGRHHFGWNGMVPRLRSSAFWCDLIDLADVDECTRVQFELHEADPHESFEEKK